MCWAIVRYVGLGRNPANLKLATAIPKKSEFSRFSSGAGISHFTLVFLTFVIPADQDANKLIKQAF